MTVERWLADASADAKARGLAIEPLLESLARATRALREADWNDDAAGGPVDGSARRTTRTP